VQSISVALGSAPRPSPQKAPISSGSGSEHSQLRSLKQHLCVPTLGSLAENISELSLINTLIQAQARENKRCPVPAFRRRDASQMSQLADTAALGAAAATSCRTPRKGSSRGRDR